MCSMVIVLRMCDSDGHPSTVMCVKCILEDDDSVVMMMCRMCGSGRCPTVILILSGIMKSSTVEDWMFVTEGQNTTTTWKSEASYILERTHQFKAKEILHRTFSTSKIQK